MTGTYDGDAAVARLTGALERQAEELRSLRTQMGVSAQEAARLLRAEEVATRLAKSRAWVYRNQHALGGLRIGGQLRFEPKEIDRYVTGCRAPTPALDPRMRPDRLLPFERESPDRGGSSRPSPA